MNIFEHTTNWYKGEIFEGAIIGVFGLCVILISIAFWKSGKTPNAQAMVIPLLVVGLLLSIAGGFMALNNSNKIKALTANKIQNHQEFTQSEEQRVENFRSLYTYTKIGAGVFFAIAIGLFFMTENRHWQAIAIGLIIISVSGLTIDYFSKERANIYYQEILKNLNHHYE